MQEPFCEGCHFASSSGCDSEPWGPSPFFVSAESKGVRDWVSVSADSKGVICTILVQSEGVFVSVANAQLKVVCLHTLSRSSVSAAMKRLNIIKVRED